MCCSGGRVPQGLRCERAQYLNFDNCCTNTNGCCTGYPVLWPPRPELKPVMVCRDCGCRYIMFQYEDDCFPLTPDFSEVRKHGFQLEISEPNACNEIYFGFLENRCIPPRVCCKCPLCRRRMRPGDHFCDCTCRLCKFQRENCLNKLRRQLLKEHCVRCECCGRKQFNIPPCCIPMPKPKCQCQENVQNCEETHQKCEENYQKCEENAEECEENAEECEEIEKECEEIQEECKEDEEDGKEKGRKDGQDETGKEKENEKQKERKNKKRKERENGSQKGRENGREKEKENGKKERENGSQKERENTKKSNEEPVPRNVQVKCPCHMYAPSSWELVKQCPKRLEYEGEVIRQQKEFEDKAAAEREERRTGIWAFLTESLSQLVWYDGRPPCDCAPNVDGDPCDCCLLVDDQCQDDEGEDGSEDSGTGEDEDDDWETESEEPDSYTADDFYSDDDADYDSSRNLDDSTSVSGTRPSDSSRPSRTSSRHRKGKLTGKEKARAAKNSMVLLQRSASEEKRKSVLEPMPSIIIWGNKAGSEKSKLANPPMSAAAPNNLKNTPSKENEQKVLPENRFPAAQPTNSLNTTPVQDNQKTKPASAVVPNSAMATGQNAKPASAVAPNSAMATGQKAEPASAVLPKGSNILTAQSAGVDEKAKPVTAPPSGVANAPKAQSVDVKPKTAVASTVASENANTPGVGKSLKTKGN